MSRKSSESIPQIFSKEIILDNDSNILTINGNGISGSTAKFTNLTASNLNIPGLSVASGSFDVVGIGTTSPLGRLGVASNTGEVGLNIGTSTSPERGNLWYNTDGTGWQFRIGKFQSSTFTPQMTFQDNGNVGIGTTIPVTKLDVNGIISIGGKPVINTVGNGANDIYGNFRVLYNDSTVNQDGMYIGYNSTGGAGAHIRFYANGVTERMRIDASNGNVGIGTTSPSDYLEVKSNGSFNTIIGTRTWWGGGNYHTIYSTAPDNYIMLGLPHVPYLESGSNGYTGTTRGALVRYGANSALSSYWDAGIASNIGSDKYAIRRADSANAFLAIDNIGNVGIGTNSPRNNLEVGNTTSNQQIRIGGVYSGPTSGYTGNGQETSRHELLFSSWRDIVTNTVGAKISAINKTALGGSPWYLVQNTDIAFSTLSSVPAGSDNTTEKMRITSNGNIGIGTASPSAKLEIQGGSSAWNETTPGQSVGTIHLDPGNTTNDFGNAITFGASDNPASPNEGTNAQAGIYIRSDGTYGTKMYFATTNDYGAGSKTRMMINELGNVGIGTNSPSTFAGGGLTLGTNASGKSIILNSSANGSNGVIQFKDLNGNDSLQIFAGSTQSDIFSYSTRPIVLSTNNLERMRIEGGGNVGIGTNGPGSKLTIGTSFASTSGITVDSANSGDSQLVLRKAASKTAFSVLAWDSATYLGSGLYYDNSSWVHNNINANSQLLLLEPGSGVNWYASSDSSVTWNVANGVRLWNDDGTWKAPIRFKNDVWIASDTDSRSRFYFANNSTTYFGTGGSYIWRSPSDTDIMTLSSDAEVTLPALTAKVAIGINSFSTSDTMLEVARPRSIGAPLIVIDDTSTQSADNSTFGRLAFRGWGGTLGDKQTRAEIRTVYAGNDGQTEMRFYTTTSSAGISSAAMYINPLSNVGIGIDPGIYRFYANHDITDYVGRFRNANAGGAGIIIAAGDATAARTLVSFRQNDNTIIGSITHNAGTVAYNAFTGAHRIYIIDNLDNYQYGTILKINNTTTSGSAVSYNGMRTTSSYDKSVIGVFVGSSSIDTEETSIYKGAYLVNSLGDGHILVCNQGGNIEVGDYICSSDTAGVGMKQNDDLLHNYTVAKATQNVNWQEQSSNVVLITCTYHAA